MSDEFGEPWNACEPWEPTENNREWCIEDSKRRYLYLMPTKELAERFVACMNACNGIATEDLLRIGKDGSRLLRMLPPVKAKPLEMEIDDDE